MHIFLYAPQDFNNLCMNLRTLEVFGIPACHVYDPNGLVRSRYGKRNLQRIASISAGAFAKVQLVKVPDPARFLTEYPGRKVATVLVPGALDASRVTFRDSDLLLFGSEVNGLPADIAGLCDLQVTIPQAGATQSLNLAVAVGIFLYAGRIQADAGCVSTPDGGLHHED